MPIEFIGMIGAKPGSETDVRRGPAIDHGYLRDFARAHDEAGFDRVLIGYGSSQPDGLQVAAYAAAPHRAPRRSSSPTAPGFVAPTVAARAFATLDQLTRRPHRGARRSPAATTPSSVATATPAQGRALRPHRRVPPGPRPRLAVGDAVRLTPGSYYAFEDFVSEVQPHQQPRIPLYFGGSSEPAIEVGARHADVFALWGEPLAETAEQIARVRAAAEAAGRDEPPRISVSFRPILGDTDEEAWERAHRILEVAEANRDVARAIGKRFGSPTGPRRTPARSGCWRPRSAASCTTARCGRRSPRPPAPTATRPRSSGTPETVAQALLDYVDIGVTTLLIRGYDPLEDAVDYGRRLLPLVRQEVARRDSLAVA